MTYICLNNGACFDYLNESTWSTLTIPVIAKSLARQHRFLGHTVSPYNTAAHSVRVSYMVPAQHALQGLLHDAAEAVLGDMPHPLKHLPGMHAYRELEDRVLAHVMRRYGLPAELSAEVREADAQAFRGEVAALASTHNPAVWGFDPAHYNNPAVPVVAWDNVTARLEFLARFAELTA